jgi:CRISPR-associated protein Cas5d
MPKLPLERAPRGLIAYVRMHGKRAIFSRVECGADRVSYEMIPHSTARGVLEQIHWKPAIRYRVISVATLTPTVWESYICNEMKSHAPTLGDMHTQRTTTCLRNPDFLIAFTIELTSKGIEDNRKDPNRENLAKHWNQICSALTTGAVHKEAPYFGIKEFPVTAELVHPDEVHKLYPIQRSFDIIPMPFDRIPYSDISYVGPQISYFIHAHVVNGILQFPSYEEVQNQGIYIPGALP